MIVKVWAIFILTLTSANVAARGAVTGGGGKGVYCKGATPEVEVLDLWEARTIFGQVIQPQSGDLKKDVDAGLVAIQAAYDIHGNTPILERLRAVAARLITPDSRVEHRHGQPLPLTDDSYEVAQPRDCPIRQIIVFQTDGSILIDQDLFDKMDETNRAALIVHEAFYALLREEVGEYTSIRARRAVGSVFSGHPFTTVPFVSIEAGDQAIQCTSEDSRQSLLLMVKSYDKTHLLVQALRLDGSRLLGTDNAPDTFYYTDTYVQMLMHQSCTTLGGQLSFNLHGPIEFDRSIELHGGCEHHGLDQSFRFEFTLKSNSPGMDQIEESVLQCRPLSAGAIL